MFKWDLHKEFSVDGYWNIPNKELNLFGELIFIPNEKLYLKLHYPLFDNKEKSFIGFINHPIPQLQGESHTGDKITLVNCLYSESRSMPGHRTAKVYFDYALITRSANIRNIERNKGLHVYVKLSCLQELFGRSFSFLSPDIKKLKKNKRQFIDIDDPPIELMKGNGFTLKVGYYKQMPFDIRDEYINYRFQLFCWIEFHNSLTIEALLKDIRYLRNFFSLLLSKQVSISNIMIERNRRESPAFLVINDPLRPETENRDNFNPLNQLNFSKNPHILQKAIKFYFDHRPFFEGSGAMYNQLNFNTISSAELRLINSVFALESFVNYFCKIPTPFTSIQWRQIKRKIKSEIDLIDKKKVELVDRAFNHLNSNTLSFKILFACKEMGMEFDYANIDIEEVVSSSVKYRNRIAHFDTKKANPISDDNVFRYTAILRVLYESLLLKKIGIENGLIQKIIYEKSEYKYYLLQSQE